MNKSFSLCLRNWITRSDVWFLNWTKGNFWNIPSLFLQVTTGRLTGQGTTVETITLLTIRAVCFPQDLPENFLGGNGVCIKGVSGCHSLFISPNLAIREGKWKLLINIDSTDVRLYNLINDPGERNNLAGQHQSIASDLAKKVIAWRLSMPVAIPGSFDSSVKND